MDTIAPSNASPILRVLLVEDSRDDAQRLGLELCDQGYVTRITRVETLNALKHALDGGPWDVLLCDQALPEMDALSALSLFQQSGLDVPFIIVSDAIPEASGIELMRAGAHDFLFKRQLNRLGAVIEREVREAELRAERRRMQQHLLLSDRLSSLGMLAASMAHEINNPLAYVLGNLEFALNRLGDGRPPNAAELTEVVQALVHAREGAERIGHTTRDLKVFCRRDDDSQTPLDVTKVMESSLSMAWNEIRHRAKLTRNFARVPRVAGNQNRLGQVFINLLVNAAQALPDAGVERNEIVVSLTAEDRNVVIEVKDNGRGMSPDQLKRIFEPFFTTKSRESGTGIGLAICHSIVTEMGGQIRVLSQPGGGTTFRVLIPSYEGVVQPTLPPKEELPPLPRARVLVIDDEPGLCAVVRRLLHQDHEVVCLSDPREALRALKRDATFDLIFCDVMMPQLSGIEFFRELQRTDRHLSEHVVFMTGGAFNAPAQQFLSTVANPLLEKPFDRHTLQAAMARVLESRPLSGTFATRVEDGLTARPTTEGRDRAKSA